VLAVLCGVIAMASLVGNTTETFGDIGTSALVRFRGFLVQSDFSGYIDLERAVLLRWQTVAGSESVRWLQNAPHWAIFGALSFLLWSAATAAKRRRLRASRASDDAQSRHRSNVRPPSKAQERPSSDRSELAAALSTCRSAFLGVGLFSAISNILMLTGSFYMLEVYDRVLSSRSIPTLVAISILAAFLFMVQGLIDMVRGRLLTRVGISLDEALSARVYSSVVRLPLKTGHRGDGLQPLRDLESIRSFLSGLGPTALFDMPWMPLYLIIIAVFHPLLGFTALVGAIILVMLTGLTEVMTRVPMKSATTLAATRNGLAESSRRNSEVLLAMGFAGRMETRWRKANEDYLVEQLKVSDVSSTIGAVSKILRQMLQSAMLGLGAYLVIHQEATGGIIIAGSILSARALAPADLAIANWKGFVVARQSWQRLDSLLKLLPPDAMPMALPAPSTGVIVENVSVVPPGATRLVVQDATFAVKAGQGLGIIGPSASGKSSLARLLVGVWLPVRGRVQIDGAAINQWSTEALGRHIGYLPQDVELFAGTVAENIARFDPDAQPDAILSAAQTARVHDLIINLPNGYETEIGEHGANLSSGQKQRIALARALYGDPFLVVLDEPNSNLDAEGEAALTQAIAEIRSRGGVVVVVAHRPSAIASVDLLLVMKQGRVEAFGFKDEVLSKMIRPASSPPPLKMVPDVGKAHP
jgi:ATP-binding cassette subfamily C protein